MARPARARTQGARASVGMDEKEMANGGEKEMRDMLNSLRIDKGRIVLMAKSEEYERLNGNALQWEHEPWYGTPYSVQRLDQDFVAQAESPMIYLSCSFPPLKRPHLIRETAISSLWHKKDDQFWVPKARIIMDIRSPRSEHIRAASVLTRLFADSSMTLLPNSPTTPI
ncbi:hypothetical protein A0H81_10726 [Grifola frondosa]|uniref:Peptidase M16 middle/third domain-containing protein n=1 Tax=Grifola frondosa TaxID=5627 RepID=A0A1C7LY21_GRIFR|nr:hypothetical protein A0H81_10726 [Grifola frondosa]